MTSHPEIADLLQAFQDGYSHRDLAAVDAFMDLFLPDAEVIGTNGVRPGEEEWYTSRAAARQLVHGDWEGWGDLLLDLPSASITQHSDAAWIAVPATVTQSFGDENYASFLEFVQDFISKSSMPAEQKLLYILRGGANTLYELHRGEKFVWPLRLTAVVVRTESGWRFAQMSFSFPTIYFPDVRIFPDTPYEGL
jgi:hypothetical protein